MPSFFPVAPEKEMQSAVKLPEKKELTGEPPKDKSKVRSKKPANAVSMLCPSAASQGLPSLGHAVKSCAICTTPRTHLCSSRKPVVEMKQDLCLQITCTHQASCCYRAEGSRAVSRFKGTCL